MEIVVRPTERFLVYLLHLGVTRWPLGSLLLLIPFENI